MKYLPILFFLLSCYGPKKAERQANKVQVHYPEIMAKKASLWYPCIPVRVSSDSAAYLEYVAKLDSILHLETAPDTIIDTILLNRVCPERKVLVKYREVLKAVPAIHDTIRVEDMACKVITADLEAENKKLIGRYAGSLKFAISLLIALIVSIIVNFIKK